MQHFVYIYVRKPNTTNGNPRHFASVYELTDNVPILKLEKVDIGYRGEESAIIEDLKLAGHLPATSHTTAYAGAKAGEFTLTQLALPVNVR
jgi:hypothetical protein